MFQNRAPEYYREVAYKDGGGGMYGHVQIPSERQSPSNYARSSFSRTDSLSTPADTEGVLPEIKKRVGSVLAREQGGVQTREGGRPKRTPKRTPTTGNPSSPTQPRRRMRQVLVKAKIGEADADKQEGEEDKEMENDEVGSSDD
ncbi:hypothetical protein K438DRAFT_1771169 [Mycena galopus ATCC 62051]|nr:hypothetical protein K438DRAFT_1771169 [Mycena galopus ATCC 62051]